MPIYEYECKQCGERFSRLRPMREIDAPAPCPKCGGEDARRLISQFASAVQCAPAG